MKYCIESLFPSWGGTIITGVWNEKCNHNFDLITFCCDYEKAIIKTLSNEFESKGYVERNFHCRLLPLPSTVTTYSTHLYYKRIMNTMSIMSVISVGVLPHIRFYFAWMMGSLFLHNFSYFFHSFLHLYFFIALWAFGVTTPWYDLQSACVRAVYLTCVYIYPLRDIDSFSLCDWWVHFPPRFCRIPSPSYWTVVVWLIERVFIIQKNMDFTWSTLGAFTTSEKIDFLGKWK